MTELPSWAVGAGAFLVTTVVGLVGALLKRAISELDKRFSDLALQIGHLQERLDAKAATTGEHAITIAIVSAQLDALDQRLKRLEGESGTCVMEARIQALEGSR